MDIYKEFGLVKIDTDNPKKFTSLVFLFDRSDFLEDLRKARFDVGLNPLNLYSRNDIELIGKLSQGQPLPSSVPRYAKKIRTNDEVLKKIFGKATDLAIEIVKKYSRTPNYIIPVTMAIISGIVIDDDFSVSPEFRVIMPGRYKNESQVGELAMIFYPETSIEEVRSVFESEKKRLFSFFQYRFFSDKQKPYDTISNIERDRYVYWLRNETTKTKKLSWKKIQEFIVPIYGDVSTRGLQLAYSRYKKGLDV